MNPRKDIHTCDIDLTAIMDREAINRIERKRDLLGGGWHFTVYLCGQVHPGYGQTVGAALADAKAINAERLAA